MLPASSAPQWERLALTSQQVQDNDLLVISKPDYRYRPTRYYDAVETEAYGQANIIDAVCTRLDELLPQPLDDVLARESAQRDELRRRLADL